VGVMPLAESLSAQSPATSADIGAVVSRDCANNSPISAMWQNLSLTGACLVPVEANQPK